MSRRLVDVRNLHYSYQGEAAKAQPALQGVDFAVEEGETVALLGETGSGKSTLLQHLNGLLVAQAGTVEVLGVNPAQAGTSLRRRVGLVFQRPENQLFERFVGDDVAYGPRQMGLRGPELTERVRWAMGTVGLAFEVYKDRLTYSLSGGERRRAGLAGVVAMRPEVLLLDEPAAGLDPVAHCDLLERIRTMKRHGVTVVISTHDMDDAAELADRVYVLKGGKVALVGSAQSVFADAAGLEAAGLTQPLAARLAAALGQRGIKLPDVPVTVDGFVNAIRTLVTGDE